MAGMGPRTGGWLLGGLLSASCLLPAQPAGQAETPLNVSGRIAIGGRSFPYLIRHLPLSAFPELPEELVRLLDLRGCLVPQTYEAHRPENVVHASLERPGSSDWAVLCSARGTVSLLVFFSSAPTDLHVLAAAPETDRLQARDRSGELGFNWGIDPASPEQVRQAQTGMEHRAPPLDHDAVADAVIDHRTVYHFFARNAWTVLEAPE